VAIAALGLSASLPSAHAQVTATGGTVTSYSAGGNVYEVRTFTESGTFTVTGGGSVNYLVVGGGGGGGGSTGGGGGAGGFVTGTTTVTDSTAYTITVGAGGAGGIANTAPYRGTNGGDSIFADVTAFGGGGGGANAPGIPIDPGLTPPSVGGSGGGGSGSPSRAGASGTALQGNAGGNANNWNGPYSAGGGGGAGAAGANANGSSTGAAGGIGLSSSITGIAKYYAGGGGGGLFNGSTGGAGGLGGGGNGGKPGAPTSGAANTGGGGGGQQQNQAGVAGSGGSGVVIISYISTSPNPTSTNATLAALENTATPLAASNFGYADPGSVALAAVEITSLPALGTLTYNGNPVANNDIIAAANIGNLSYLSPLGGFGSPYTTIGIKVQNANTLWSSDALMTVNVTHVNQPPTSTGGSVILRENTVKTFAAADFQFSDIDAGDTLQAIKVTSLPAHGTLNVALDTEILVADIGTLTYTPDTDYTGADTYNFQVSDGALFSADAAMAITVTPDILVLNGSFETTGQGIGGPWFMFGSPWSITGSPSPYQVINAVAGGAFSSTVAGGGTYIGLVNNDDCPITAPLVQNLGVSVTAGDTLTVTFQRGNPLISSGGAGVAYFDVDGTKYTMPFDTTGMTTGTWQLTTMTQTITNSGNLTLGFYGTTGNGVNVWVDLVSNVSVTTGSGPTPVSYADWAATNGVTGGVSGDSNNDGVQNGVAYFMGVTGLATNPGLDASNQVIWPMSPTFSGTYEVQTSSDLSTWTAASPQPTASGGNLTYTLPSGLGTQFVRLVVTPN
jgi:hypothetical protein